VGEILVVNTGPLIALERMGCLEPIGTLPFEFVTPPEVRAELDEGARPSSISVTPTRWLPGAGVEWTSRRVCAVIAILRECRGVERCPLC
jgi:hypothetical protein